MALRSGKQHSFIVINMGLEWRIPHRTGVKSLSSVANSSDGLIFGERRALFFNKNTGIRRAKRQAKFKLLFKEVRTFDSQHFNDKSA